MACIKIYEVCAVQLRKIHEFSSPEESLSTEKGAWALIPWFRLDSTAT